MKLSPIVTIAAAALSATFFIRGVGAYSNLYGNQLESCSSSGMALTGYTRTGYCVDENDDTGSHHICIDLSSTRTEQNFCYVTGQDDWCSENMPCHDDSNNDHDNDNGNDDDSNQCPVQNWCVCQWAFASYIQNAGGCDNVQDIVCEAINEEAIIAYKQQSDQAKFQEALECIADRCGISIEGIRVRASSYSLQRKTAALWGLILVFAAALTAAFYYTSRRQTMKAVEGAYLTADDKHISNGTIE